MAITLCMYASRAGGGSGQHAGIRLMALAYPGAALLGSWCASCCMAQLPTDRRPALYQTSISTKMCLEAACVLPVDSALARNCSQPFPHQNMTNPPCYMYTTPLEPHNPQSFPVEPLEKSIKVVGCGSCGVDYLASVAAFPHPDQKLRTDALEVRGKRSLT